MPLPKAAGYRRQPGSFGGDQAQRTGQQAQASLNALLGNVALSRLFALFAGEDADGIVRGVIFATATPRLVRHNLGYTPRGYIMTRSYGSDVAIFLEGGMATPEPKTDIAMTALVDCTVDLFFF